MATFEDILFLGFK